VRPRSPVVVSWSRVNVEDGAITLHDDVFGTTTLVMHVLMNLQL
jgi:hypothetical protein